MDHDRLLLVAGDPVERMMLEARLRGAGFAVTSAASAERARPLLAAQSFALLITTLRLPDTDGVALLREARASHPELEVILLTAAATIESLIAAVDYGACAYLCLPVDPGMLEARITAGLARRQINLTRATVLRYLSAQILRVAEPERAAYSAELAPPPARCASARLSLTLRAAAPRWTSARLHSRAASSICCSTWPCATTRSSRSSRSPARPSASRAARPRRPAI